MEIHLHLHSSLQYLGAGLYPSQKKMGKEKMRSTQHSMKIKKIGEIH